MDDRRTERGSAADTAVVRETYARYDELGRERLWDRGNRGFDRLKSESERALVGLIAASLTDGDRPTDVIDLGCGTGDLAVLARSAGLTTSWTGIDLLPDRVAVAQERVPAGRFLVEPVEAMPFEDGSFDVATAVTLFSSIPSHATEVAAAREIGRVLRRGGWLIWYDIRYDNPSNPAVHGLTHARLAVLFPGWQVELRSSTVLPPLARRLGPLTPVAYPLLHALPPLRSHLIGRLRCPA